MGFSLAKLPTSLDADAGFFIPKQKRLNINRISKLKNFCEEMSFTAFLHYAPLVNI